MSGGGVIVRLLMGFLAISKVEEKSKVHLPQSSTKIKTSVDVEEPIIIGIYREKGDPVVRYIFESEKKNKELRSLDSVQSFILGKKKFYEDHQRKMKVRLRSDWNLPIRYTMKIAKFCQKNGLKVGIDVEEK